MLVVKNPPTKAGVTQETQVPSLDWECSLEKETATHSSILAWRIPWTEEPGGPQSLGWQRVRSDTAEVTQHIYIYIHVCTCVHTPTCISQEDVNILTATSLSMG